MNAKFNFKGGGQECPPHTSETCSDSCRVLRGRRETAVVKMAARQEQRSDSVADGKSGATNIPNLLTISAAPKS
jgi:hypothetical protein